jgi:hypothetical protein
MNNGDIDRKDPGGEMAEPPDHCIPVAHAATKTKNSRKIELAYLALRGRLFLEMSVVLSTPISKLVHVPSYQGRISGGGPPE